MSDTTKTATARTPHPCACLTGTGLTCPATTLKSFAQGHDARMSSRLAQDVADGKMSEADAVALIRKAGGGDLLVSKTTHSAKLRANKPAKTPKAAKPAKETPAAKPEPTVVNQKTKVFHGKREFHAVVVRNASQELVARHRLSGKNCDHQVEVGEDGEIFTK